jgi:hypothetical protein
MTPQRGAGRITQLQYFLLNYVNRVLRSTLGVIETQGNEFSMNFDSNTRKKYD